MLWRFFQSSAKGKRIKKRKTEKFLTRWQDAIDRRSQKTAWQSAVSLFNDSTRNRCDKVVDITFYSNYLCQMAVRACYWTRGKVQRTSSPKTTYLYSCYCSCRADAVTDIFTIAADVSDGTDFSLANRPCKVVRMHPRKFLELQLYVLFTINVRDARIACDGRKRVRTISRERANRHSSGLSVHKDNVIFTKKINWREISEENQLEWLIASN